MDECRCDLLVSRRAKEGDATYQFRSMEACRIRPHDHRQTRQKRRYVKGVIAVVYGHNTVTDRRLGFPYWPRTYGPAPDAHKVEIIEGALMNILQQNFPAATTGEIDS